MHEFFRVAILVAFAILSVCIIGGCTENNLTGNSDEQAGDSDERVKINLVATIPADGGVISTTGDLWMVFDNAPSSVTVDGNPARIQDNLATVSLINSPNVQFGDRRRVTIEWRNQADAVAGVKTIGFSLIDSTIAVTVDPPPGSQVYQKATEFTLWFSGRVKAVKLNGAPASDGRYWEGRPNLQLGPGQALKVEWVNRDGSTDAIEVGPYNVLSIPPGPPMIIYGTPTDGEINVNLEPINAWGFQYDFDRSVTGAIRLTDAAGVDLEWRGHVHGKIAVLAPWPTKLTNDGTYRIEINVRDDAGNQLLTTITFVTEPE